MSELKKTILNSILAIVALLLTAFLWTNALILSLSLFVVAIVMLLIERHRSAVFIYVIAFTLGPSSEALVIYFGAWTYTEPHLLGFPTWLPFLWGGAGLFINRLNIYIRSLDKN